MSRFSPYPIRKPRLALRPTPPPPSPISYMDIDLPLCASPRYMEVDGLERPVFPRASLSRSFRAQMAHPHTTRQARVAGSRSLQQGRPRGGCGTLVCRTRVLSGGWAALEIKYLPEWRGMPPPMDMDVDD
ncbi:hypothetical protein BGZ46_003635 [Entomortierella lignicola]|nr:hypothetical protein BGZ46_003635 [Entomortierella lignicola]